MVVFYKFINFHGLQTGRKGYMAVEIYHFNNAIDKLSDDCVCGSLLSMQLTGNAARMAAVQK